MADNLNKPGGEKISKEEADKMTKAYKDHNKGKTEKVGFSAEFIRSLVNDPSADTVWIAFAETNEGDNTVVIETFSASNSSLNNGDRGLMCPPYC